MFPRRTLWVSVAYTANEELTLNYAVYDIVERFLSLDFDYPHNKSVEWIDVPGFVVSVYMENIFLAEWLHNWF